MPLTRDQIVGDDDERMAFKFTMLNDGKVVQLATLERHCIRPLAAFPSTICAAVDEPAKDNEPTDDGLLSTPRQKPPSKRSGKSCCPTAHREALRRNGVGSSKRSG